VLATSWSPAVQLLCTAGPGQRPADVPCRC
jgi:hypothetical protein